ncbi:MAG: helix-turn-helix domain-containing protein, partial [Steroidobacteraceae bacterium]
VERLASRANLSPRHFAREFAAQVGATPAAYVTRVRVEEARRRIEDGATQLKDVARQCGFGDEQRLRRAFRRTLGVTPQDYRARFAP